MSWLDKHRRRAMTDGGSIRQAYKNQSADFINYAFDDSPTFLIAKINDSEYDARLVIENKYTSSSGIVVKKLLFRPYTVVDRGDVAEFNNEKWLITHFENKDLVPKAIMRFCNNTLTFKDGTSHPCVLDRKVSIQQKIREEIVVDLPSDTMKVTVSYNNDTKKIKELDRFIFNRSVWEVHGVDPITQVLKGKGIIEFNVRRVPLNEREREKIEEAIPDYIEYHVSIIGDDEIGLNQTTSFEAIVTKNGEPIVDIVEWSCSHGKIDSSGLYMSPDYKINATIKAKYLYTDSQGEVKEAIGEKSVNVYDGGWGGWG